MARVSVCGMMMMMMMMMMIMGAAAQAPAPAVDCESVVLTLSDCLGFVTGTDKTPPAACCTELATVVKNSPQCLCLLFNTTFTAPLGVNVTRAQQLPPACNVQTPPTSLCGLLGVPVPSPSSSPAVAPSPAAKTPASSKAPTPALAPASSPMAPSPSTTSPTPMASSLTPMASPPSPLTTAPAGSMVPSTPTGSTITPSPSSAPAIISRNAAVAASLLLASIFLS